MKITKDNFFLKFCLLLAFFLGIFNFVLAPVSAKTLWDKQVGMETNNGAGEAFGEDPGVGRNGVRDIRLVLANAIKVFLGFMGIIFLILIIYGGFMWMTAAGQEENINKAKSLLVAGVIGLIVILASFGIAELVTSKIYDATITT